MKEIEEQAVKILYDLQYTGDVDKDCFIDMLSFGRCTVHIDKDGKKEHWSADPRKTWVNPEILNK